MSLVDLLLTLFDEGEQKYDQKTKMKPWKGKDTIVRHDPRTVCLSVLKASSTPVYSARLIFVTALRCGFNFLW
jgi:hypothetical protein